jgi:glycosyltransferase involved in cell wall biosynthesis
VVDALAPLVRRVPARPRPLVSATVWAAATRPRRFGLAVAWSWRWAWHDRDPRQLVAVIHAAYIARRLRPGTRLHAHFANTPATVALLAGHLAEAPVSITGHARDLFAATSPAFLAEKVRRATLLACGSEFAAGRVRAMVDPADVGKVVVIRNGVTAPASPLPAPVEPVPTVLAVARLVRKKGLDTLLRSVAALRRDGVALRTEIVGAGPERRALEALARELGVADMVVFHGALDREGVDAALARATVFALPSRPLADGDADGLPVAIVEALAAGVPVVSTRVAGIPEAVIDGRSGLLVEPDDLSALTAALRTVVEDPELAERLRAGAREVATEHDLQANVARLASLLEPGSARP